MGRIRINCIVLFSCLLVLTLPIFGADKFCNSTGIFYCAIAEAYPELSKNCGSLPTSAIIKGVNYLPIFSGGSGWSYEPWKFSRSTLPSGKQNMNGISQLLIYTDAWRNPNSHPPTIGNTTEIAVYNCKLCPPGTSLKNNGVYSYCLADSTQDPTNNGDNCQNSTGRPINISTGNKYYHEIDYLDGNFSISRSFNSSAGRWAFNYRQQLYLHSLSNQTLKTGSDGKVYYPHDTWALRADGKVDRFTYKGAAGHSYSRGTVQAQIGLRLTNPDYNFILSQYQGDIYLRNGSGLLVIENDRPLVPELGNTHELVVGQTKELYDVRGRLTSIQSPSQVPYELTYLDKTITITKGSSQVKIVSDDKGRVAKIILPDESELNYQYDTTQPQSNILQSVSRTYGGGAQVQLRKYFYEDARFPTHITGVEDENGSRISSVQYDEQGRAISSEYGPLNSGIERSRIRYNTNGTRTLTNALGKDTTYNFSQFNGEYKITQITGHPSSNCTAGTKAYTYDLSGLMSSKTDWKGSRTIYIYNPRGLEVSRTEAAGTVQARTITTEWHPTLFLPVTVSEPTRITTYTYDAQGRQLSQTVTPR